MPFALSDNGIIDTNTYRKISTTPKRKTNGIFPHTHTYKHTHQIRRKFQQMSIIPKTKKLPHQARVKSVRIARDTALRHKAILMSYTWPAGRLTKNHSTKKIYGKRCDFSAENSPWKGPIHGSGWMNLSKLSRRVRLDTLAYIFGRHLSGRARINPDIYLSCDKYPWYLLCGECWTCNVRGCGKIFREWSNSCGWNPPFMWSSRLCGDLDYCCLYWIWG